MIDKSKFADKKELFKYLYENKADILTIKKASVKFTDVLAVPQFEENTNKAKQDGASEFLTIIGNTYNWLDSHDDVHIEGIFTKSLKENQDKILHLHDHVYELTAKVGKPQRIYEQNVAWATLGVSLPGETTCLLMDSKILEDYNKAIFMMYQNGEITQHSVGMYYVNLFMCINDPEYPEEYRNWIKYFPLIGNASKAWDNGYFFAITEAKLKEISCVIAGSNELTGILEPPQNGVKVNIEPQNSTQTGKDLLINFKIW